MDGCVCVYVERSSDCRPVEPLTHIFTCQLDWRVCVCVCLHSRSVHHKRRNALNWSASQRKLVTKKNSCGKCMGHRLRETETEYWNCWRVQLAWFPEHIFLCYLSYFIQFIYTFHYCVLVQIMLEKTIFSLVSDVCDGWLSTPEIPKRKPMQSKMSELSSIYGNRIWDAIGYLHENSPHHERTGWFARVCHMALSVLAIADQQDNSFVSHKSWINYFTQDYF